MTSPARQASYFELGCIRIKGYAPGVVTGVLIYFPLSVYAYAHFLHSGQLTTHGLIVSGALGLLYQAVPLVYFVSAYAIKQVGGWIS